MIVSKISASNLKGLSFEDELAALTIITGPNFRGKTARLMALRLALMGYDPKMGVSNQASFSASSDNKLAVGATLSDGVSYNREWSQNAKGAVACKGSDGVVANPTLDPSAYFALGPTKRMEYIFEKADLGKSKWTAEQIRSDFHEWMVSQLCDKLLELEWGGVDEVRVQDVFVALLESAKGFTKDASAEKKRCAETMMKLTELKLGDAASTSHRINQVKEKIDKLRVENDRLSKEIGKELSSVKEWESAENRRKQVVANIGRVQKLMDETRAIKPVVIKGEYKDVTPLISSVMTKLNDATARRQGLMDRGVSLKSQIEARETILKDIRKRLSAFEGKQVCPTCGAKAAHGLDAIVRLMNDEIRDVENAIKEMRSQRETLIEQYRKANEERESLVNEEARLRKSEKENTAIKEAMIREESAVKSRQESIMALSKELSGWEQMLTKEAPRPNVEESLVKSQEKINTDIAEQEQLQNKLVATKRDIELVATTKKMGDEAEKLVEVLKSAQAWIKEKQSALITEVISPILTVANKIFSVCGKELELRDGEIGYWCKHRFVSHLAFSGTEEQLAYVGFAAGLASHSTLRLVQLDEFGRLDTNTKTKCLQQLQESVKDGIIDQVIVVDADSGFYKKHKSDWKIIEVV